MCRSCRAALLLSAVLTLILPQLCHADDAGVSVVAQQDQIVEISRSGKLDPALIKGRLVITASNITIDGGDLTLVGGTGSPKSFVGTAVTANGVSNVTLKNFKARGWETGLKISDGSGWVVENCDLSGNFHDPEFGWGENGRRGGMVLERVLSSTFKGNKANHVWDGCVLIDSDENTIEGNDFSHASNTCLKLWHASKNVIRKNVLSYGIRINPGEVHARDSTSVLIESGSNDNQFVENDCTHGGDGIFVRVLNGWCSTGNLFERNDCSYANNNGFECWARDNVFRNNKANYCSYGFWMGGSDHTRLDGNEASFNGLKNGNHNSPHLPGNGHAGIVFMFGPSSHTVARGNKCIGNNGAGIAVIGDIGSKGKKWKAHHWIIQENLLAQNRWGIYLQYVDWIQLLANQFSTTEFSSNDNTISDVQIEEGVTRLTDSRVPLRDGRPRDTLDSAPTVNIECPSSAHVGDQIHFAARLLKPVGDNARYSWDLGDGTTSELTELDHIFQAPGFYRIGLSVNSKEGADLAWRDFYVVDDVKEIGTEGTAAEWSIEDFHDRQRSDKQVSRAELTDDKTSFLVGRSALKVVIRPYAGFRAALTFPKSRDAHISLQGKSKLIFWMKVINEDVTGWQGGPFVVLQSAGDARTYIEPKQGRDLMRELENNEGRDGWRRLEIPLRGDDRWETQGEIPAEVQAVSLAFDSWGAPTLRIWIDGLSFE